MTNPPESGRFGVNLHSHLEGSVRPETAAELAAAAGLEEPSEGWPSALRMPRAGSLTTFLLHVANAYPLFTNGDAVRRLVYEAVEDAYQDGVAYLELRFGPATHASAGLSIAEVIGAACEGLEDGMQATGMRAGLVVCVLRQHDLEANEEVARGAAAHAGRGVVGFDVAGDELLFPSVEPFVKPFRIAAAAGLGLTAHASEAGTAHHLRDAVRLLGARRVGHGTRAIDDSETITWAANNGICFEVCPTSNVLTGAVASYGQHPIRAFLEAGCDVVVGDDDPTTTGVSFSEEIQNLVDRVGLTPSQVTRIHGTSVERAFCDDATRNSLRERLSLAVSR